MRCEEHGLAAGPGGECVVCLRDARARAEQRARRLGAGFCAFVVLACGGLFAARLLRNPPLAEPPLLVAVHATEPAAAEPSAALEPSRELAAPTFALANPLATAEPLAAASAISPAPPASAVPAAERAPSARVPSKRELMTALQATPVSMFSTNWCPHCERARRFFRAYGLSVVDHDVDADARAASELKRRSGSKAVPLIDVDGVELRGFDEQATMQAVVASVERRLGVTGIKLSVAAVPN